jgi:hypothetical protein
MDLVGRSAQDAGEGGAALNTAPAIHQRVTSRDRRHGRGTSTVDRGIDAVPVTAAWAPAWRERPSFSA